MSKRATSVIRPDRYAKELKNAFRLAREKRVKAKAKR